MSLQSKLPFLVNGRQKFGHTYYDWYGQFISPILTGSLFPRCGRFQRRSTILLFAHIQFYPIRRTYIWANIWLHNQQIRQKNYSYGMCRPLSDKYIPFFHNALLSKKDIHNTRRLHKIYAGDRIGWHRYMPICNSIIRLHFKSGSSNCFTADHERYFVADWSGLWYYHESNRGFYIHIHGGWCRYSNTSSVYLLFCSLGQNYGQPNTIKMD